MLPLKCCALCENQIALLDENHFIWSFGAVAFVPATKHSRILPYYTWLTDSNRFGCIDWRIKMCPLLWNGFCACAPCLLIFSQAHFTFYTIKFTERFSETIFIQHMLFVHSILTFFLSSSCSWFIRKVNFFFFLCNITLNSQLSTTNTFI